jgi:hypothetical protein
MWHGLLYGVTRTELWILKCESQSTRIQGMGYQFTAMTIYDARRRRIEPLRRIENVLDQWLASEFVQDLWKVGTHPRSFSGSQNYDV